MNGNIYEIMRDLLLKTDPIGSVFNKAACGKMRMKYLNAVTILIKRLYIHHCEKNITNKICQNNRKHSDDISFLVNF